MRYAIAARGSRLQSPTEAETEMANILLAICGRAGFEREKIITYANGSKFIIVDFFIGGSNIGIEIDGNSHRLQLGYDGERDKWLQGQGIKIIRFSNREVLKTPEAVKEKIMELLDSREAPRLTTD